MSRIGYTTLPLQMHSRQRCNLDRRIDYTSSGIGAMCVPMSVLSLASGSGLVSMFRDTDVDVSCILHFVHGLQDGLM